MTTFESIVSSSKTIVIASARRFLGDPSDANVQDVAQDVYVILYREWRKKKLQSVSDLNNYIYTVTKHQSFKFNKKHSYHTDLQTDHIEAPELSNDEKETLHELVSKTPEKYRTILQLVLKGYGLTEISNGLSLNLNTVKSLFKRGKEQLKKQAEEAQA
jgi:RNA polymerase sigma factor (sigma-70 family)